MPMIRALLLLALLVPLASPPAEAYTVGGCAVTVWHGPPPRVAIGLCRVCGADITPTIPPQIEIVWCSIIP